MDMVGSIKRCILARHAAHFAGGLDSEVAVVSLLFRHENGKWLSQAEITYYLDKCLPW